MKKPFLKFDKPAGPLRWIALLLTSIAGTTVMALAIKKETEKK